MDDVPGAPDDVVLVSPEGDVPDELSLRTHGLSLGLTVLSVVLEMAVVNDVEDALREALYGEMVVD